MPNWSYNTIALQGKKEAMHEFIKLGLRNSNLEVSDDIVKDFNLLCEQGKTKVTVHDEMTDFEAKKREIGYEDDFTARTFLPMPDTFLMYDTTNYANDFPIEVVKEQKEKYGAVGWYDYNCLTLGTKWNFGFGEEIEFEEVAPGVWRFQFYCQTAWSMPLAWCANIKKLFPDISIFIFADEESGSYLLCGEVDENGDIIGEYDATDKKQQVYSEWEKKREEVADHIKADAEKMEEVKKKVAEKMENNEGGITEEEYTDWTIDDMVDEECGECCDFDELNDEVRAVFDKMLEEKI